jgi:cytochrome c2
MVVGASALAAVTRPPLGDPAKGATIFRQFCASCPGLSVKNRPIGPSLVGALADGLARPRGYAYSAALHDYPKT